MAHLREKVNYPKVSIIIPSDNRGHLIDHALRFHVMCSHMEKMGFRCYDIAGQRSVSMIKQFGQWICYVAGVIRRYFHIRNSNEARI